MGNEMNAQCTHGARLWISVFPFVACNVLCFHLYITRTNGTSYWTTSWVWCWYWSFFSYSSLVRTWLRGLDYGLAVIASNGQMDQGLKGLYLFHVPLSINCIMITCRIKHLIHLQNFQSFKQFTSRFCAKHDFNYFNVSSLTITSPIFCLVQEPTYSLRAFRHFIDTISCARFCWYNFIRGFFWSLTITSAKVAAEWEVADYILFLPNPWKGNNPRCLDTWRYEGQCCHTRSSFCWIRAHHISLNSYNSWCHQFQIIQHIISTAQCM